MDNDRPPSAALQNESETLKIAICQELYEDTPWAQQCELIAEAGYTGIEIAPFSISDDLPNVSDERLDFLKETAEANGLEIIGLHWLLAKTSGLHLTSSDEAVRKATANYLKLLARVCRHLGGDVLVFGSPQQRNVEREITQTEASAFAADVFRHAMPEFERQNVRLCMEPLTQKETNFINTCADAMKLMKLVDHPNFVLHQDVKAMLGAESDSLPVLIHRYQDVCGHFHVNDANLLGPGMGNVDFHPILRALQETKYQGWISVEVFDYTPGAQKIAKKSFDYLAAVLKALNEEHNSNSTRS